MKVIEKNLDNMTRINEKIQNLSKLWDTLRNPDIHYVLNIYTKGGDEVLCCESRTVRYMPTCFTCLNLLQNKLFSWADYDIVEIKNCLLNPYKWLPQDLDILHRQFIAASELIKHPSIHHVVVYRETQPKETTYRLVYETGEICLPFKGTKEWDEFISAFVAKELEGLQDLYAEEAKCVLDGGGV
jgi:hypothetical protein